MEKTKEQREYEWTVAALSNVRMHVDSVEIIYYDLDNEGRELVGMVVWKLDEM